MNEQNFRAKMLDAYCLRIDRTSRAVCDLAAYLRNTYRDYMRYRYYHILIGSTPTGDCDRRDFPEKEIERFVIGLRTIPGASALSNLG